MDVHPLAAIFLMMSEGELQDLADDIREHGRRQPIVIDADGVLIDGRNRLKAYEMAGVEPRFVRLNGEDPAAYILSANVERRSLTAGQKAMTRAIVSPEAKMGRPKAGEEKVKS
jgi:ParB-like chromosome segregation protein Spo0J